MKRISIFTTLLATFIFIASCSDKSVPIKKDNELNQSSLGDDIPSEVATEVFDKAPITTKNAPQLEEEEEDCHGKRMTSQTLEDVEGTILKIGDKFIISTNNGSSRYNACKIPENLQKEGILVRFTGDVLEIFPGERLMATPFRLRNIVERDR
jgi:PBP1b-binding outer membrane lipoprotein LpoB